MTRPHPAAPHQDPSVVRFLVIAARGVLLVVLAALPWALAGTDLRVQIVATVALAVAAALTGLSAACGSPDLGVPSRSGRMAEVAAIAFLALAIVQATRPEPPDEPVRGVTQWLPLSAYPAATREAAAVMLLGLSAFSLSSRLFAYEGARTTLYAVAATTGAATAVFGIAQKLQWDGRVYGVFEATGHIFAAFPNRNAACGYLALTAACAVALMTMPRRDRAETVIPVGLFGAIAGAFVIAGAVGSGSRGGLAAVLISAAAGGLAGLRGGRPGWRRLGLVAAGSAFAVALTSWLSLSDEVSRRLRSLQASGVFADSRWAHWRETFPAVGDRPLFGAGLGTYDYATLAYVSETRGSWFRHADNQYLEVLVESGAVGFAVVAVVVAALAVAAIRLLRSASADVTAGTCLLAALAGQLVLAFSAFGILMPANLTLMAAIAGSSTAVPRPAASRRFYPTVAAMTYFSVAGVLATRELAAAERVARAEAVSPATRPALATGPVDIRTALRPLEDALSARPDDAVGQRKLAESLVAGYRRETFARLLAADSGLPEDKLWSATDLPQLYGAACAATDLRPLREDPAVGKWLAPAERHYRLAQKACPRLPRIDSALAALGFLSSERPAAVGRKRLEAALLRFPADPDLAYTAGRMAWESGDLDFAGRAWRRTLELTQRYDPAIREIAATRLPTAVQIDLLLPDDPAVILRFASTRPPAGAVFWDQAALVDRAVALLGPASRPGGSRLLAKAEMLRGNFPNAVTALGRAVLEEPQDANLRTEYSDALWKTSRYDDAIRELRIAAGLEPGRADRAKLLERRVTERAALPGTPD